MRTQPQSAKSKARRPFAKLKARVDKSILIVRESLTSTTHGKPVLAKATQREAAKTAQKHSAAELASRVIERRAIEAVIWGMPVVNFDLMYQEMARKAQGRFNQILYWPRLLDWKNQTLTPNPDVIYLMPFFNTQDGPIVLEVPPADDGLLNGSIMNRWQAAIEDIGPGGVDKGRGGKYLVLPPGYDVSKVPERYIPMASDCTFGYALIRSVPKSGSDADVAKAVAYSKRIKLYPLSQAENPPPTEYVDASNVIVDSTIPYDLRFFESLQRMVDAEPWLERDKAMIDPLKSIGIERGKPFHPDARTERILKKAIQEAKLVLEANYRSSPPFYEGKHWFFPATEEIVQNVQRRWNKADSYPIDNRAVLYSIAFFSAMHIGQSQYYLMAVADKSSRALSGNLLYRLTVPAEAPVTQYWSMTVYNSDTHAFIRHAKWVGRSSQTPGLQTNEDGSTDIYFGAKPPRGKESNWIPTDPKGRFEVLARFYGPLKPLFDKTWQLGDVEEVRA